MKNTWQIILIFFLIGCSGKPAEPVDEKFQCTPNTFNDLPYLQEEIKFGKEEYYSGLLPKEKQWRANDILNWSIENLKNILLKDDPTKKDILNEYRRALKDFDKMELDPEDRERVRLYYYEISEIIGLDSTDGVLKDWRR